MKRRHRWRRSLGARLVGVFLLLAVGVTATFLAGMQTALRGGWQDYVRPLVNHYADLLAAEIGTPPDRARAQALTERLPLRIRIEGPTLNWDSQPGTAAHGWAGHAGDRAAGDETDRHRTWRPVRVLADGHRISFSLADLSREDRPRNLVWVTLAVLLLLTALAFGYVRHLLAPLKDIGAGAQRFGEGRFTPAITVRRHDELGVLATQINGMADALQKRLEAQRALLLAISHELRSPLTRARVNAELVEEGAARDSLLRDLAQMRDLVTDLLETERLAGGPGALQSEEVDLNALLVDVIASHFAGRALQVTTAKNLPLLRLDPSRMRLLLRNLIDNALRHGASGSQPPQVSVSVEADNVVVRVRDFGPGVEPEHLAHLAEAFYRTDAARQRSTGGVGLGLYLCRLVAQAHGGRLVFAHAHPGLQAEVTLPLRRS
jgi:signal transduction histidine kinase